MDTANRRENSCDMTHEQGCILAEEVADRAVKKTLALLGVDVDKPESVEEFREDLRFSRSMRKYANKGVGAFITALVVFLFGALVLGLQDKFGG